MVQDYLFFLITFKEYLDKGVFELIKDSKELSNKYSFIYLFENHSCNFYIIDNCFSFFSFEQGTFEYSFFLVSKGAFTGFETFSI